MAEDKVVTIHGAVLPEPGKPNLTLVAFLEDQLERARVGETIGFAGATLDKDRSATYWLAGMTGGFSMVGALECAQRKLTANAMGEQ